MLLLTCCWRHVNVEMLLFTCQLWYIPLNMLLSMSLLSCYSWHTTIDMSLLTLSICHSWHSTLDKSLSACNSQHITVNMPLLPCHSQHVTSKYHSWHVTLGISKLRLTWSCVQFTLELWQFITINSQFMSPDFCLMKFETSWQIICNQTKYPRKLLQCSVFVCFSIEIISDHYRLFPSRDIIVLANWGISYIQTELLLGYFAI